VSVTFDPAGVIEIDSTANIASEDGSGGARIQKLIGTWQRDASTLSLRTEGSVDATSCVEGVGRYSLTFSEDCRSLSLALIADACADRSSTLAGFVGNAE
jgi:hypothetical protein